MTTRFSDRYKEIIWGGKVRPSFQSAVWNAAVLNGHEEEVRISGSMVSSEETRLIKLLDGMVRETHGYFDGSSGMFISGEKALQLILYEIGENPNELLLAPQKRWTWKELHAEAEKALRDIV
jgi:hypothetical protein